MRNAGIVTKDWCVMLCIWHKLAANKAGLHPLGDCGMMVVAMRRGLQRHRTLSLILPSEGMFHYEQAEAAVKERRGRRTLYRLHMPPLR